MKARAARAAERAAVFRTTAEKEQLERVQAYAERVERMQAALKEDSGPTFKEAVASLGWTYEQLRSKAGVVRGVELRNGFGEVVFRGAMWPNAWAFMSQNGLPGVSAETLQEAEENPTEGGWER